MDQWSYAYLIMIIIPFIPPIIVGQASRRINERLAEHDFIKDSLPFVFVAYPTLPSEHSLSHCPPQSVSDSAIQHTGITTDELLHRPVLPPDIFEDATQRKSIIKDLLKAYHIDKKHGEINNVYVRLRPHKHCQQTQTYILSSSLKRRRNHLKWQGVLFPHHQHPVFSD